jgi:hypothetical protein
VAIVFPRYHLQGKVTNSIFPVGIDVSHRSTNKRKTISLCSPHVMDKGILGIKFLNKSQELKIRVCLQPEHELMMWWTCYLPSTREIPAPSALNTSSWICRLTTFNRKGELLGLSIERQLASTDLQYVSTPVLVGSAKPSPAGSKLHWQRQSLAEESHSSWLARLDCP